jgi:predicted DsbA family dithiol-disulfide isomerase
MLVVWFDYASLPAAVAVLRVQSLADGSGSVAFQGVDPLGVEVTLPATLDQLDGFERAHAAAEAVGLAPVRPRLRPATVRAHLVGELADAAGRGAGWRGAALRALWEAGEDLADPLVLRTIARRVGLDPDAVDDLLADPARLRALRRRMAHARQRGIGDVPVLEVDGTLVSAELADDDLRALLAT